MKQDTADYLAEVAEDLGIVNWSIGDYHPEGLPHKKVLAFMFDGVTDLKRLRRNIMISKLQGTKTIIDTHQNKVTIY